MAESKRPSYKSAFNKSSDKIPFSECLKLNIDLQQHLELPQGLKWCEAKVSSKCEFIGARAIGPNYHYVFIWRKDNLGKILYSYTSTNIFCFDIATNNLSFIIVYENEGIVHYNMKSGNRINFFDLKEKISKPITSSFSPQCRFYLIATEEAFFVWDCLNGKSMMNVKERSVMKYIRNDFFVSITSDGVVKVMNSTKAAYKCSFQLSGIAHGTEILACVLNEALNELYYALKSSIYKATIPEGVITKVMDFEGFDTVTAFISPDCRTYYTTDFNIIFFWEEGKGNIGSIPKQKFSYLSFSFSNSIMITIDDISITFKNFADLKNDMPPITIWTNSNVNEFKEMFFSSDYTVVLTKIDEHNAAIWNCNTGQLLYKWHNALPNWYQAVEMSPMTSQLSVLATKSSENLVEIWDYSTGIPLIPLMGFNAYSVKFSREGYSIAAGTVEGEEIARVWDLNNFEDPIIFLNESEPNKNTVVYLTSDSAMLICHSQHQAPLVFESSTGTLVSRCECELNFTYIKDLKSADDCRTFYSCGYTNKEPIASFWSLEECKVLQNFSNCTNIRFAEDSIHFFTYKTSNIIQGTKNQSTIWTIEKDLMLVPIEIPISVEDNFFTDDSSILISLIAVENEDRYVITEISTGVMLGEVVYTQIEKGYSRTHLSVQGTNLLLRRITIG